jgi:hypothetical protein
VEYKLCEEMKKYLINGEEIRLFDKYFRKKEII